MYENKSSKTSEVTVIYVQNVSNAIPFSLFSAIVIIIIIIASHEDEMNDKYNDK